MSESANRPRGSSQRVVFQTLETLALTGVTHLPRGRRKPNGRTAEPPPTAGKDAATVADAARVEERSIACEAAPVAAASRGSHGSADSDRVATLEIIRLEVAACTRCAELASTRKQTVFGSGNPHPRLVFMGEAPGADEDRQGLPFVGRAGQLLTKIIEACTLKRDDVYILNTLKCRPPENRTPLPHEAANCREYLDRQLDVLAPEYICCLGAVAAQNLLGTTSTIGRLRGSLHEYRGIRVLCTYHPAYLLRNPAAKKDCWQDMQLLMREMGIPLPG